MFYVKLEPLTPDNHCLIDCGRGHFAIVDPADFPNLNEYKWRVRKSYRNFYAVRSPGPQDSKALIYMHRVIAGTGPDEVGHHCNHNTLDNRRGNILNCINEVHRDFHGIRRWTHGKWQKTRKTRVVALV